MDLKSVPESQPILYPGVVMESVALWFLGSVMRSVVAVFTGLVRMVESLVLVLVAVADVVEVLVLLKPPIIWQKWTASWMAVGKKKTTPGITSKSS